MEVQSFLSGPPDWFFLKLIVYSSGEECQPCPSVCTAVYTGAEIRHSFIPCQDS